MSEKKGSKSMLTYLHQKSHKEVKNGKVVVREESIIDGPKGLSFKLYVKSDDKKIKYAGKSDNGKFKVYVKEDDKKEEYELDHKEVLEMLKKNKDLQFIYEYVKNYKPEKGSQKGGSKKRSKKGSKKGSRKGSRKGSKMGSKKGSKRGSKN